MLADARGELGLASAGRLDRPAAGPPLEDNVNLTENPMPTRELPADETVPMPQAGEFWKHFKGGLYEVICLALDEASGAELVVYAAASGRPPTWVRTLARWRQVVTTPEGERVPRFARYTPPEPADTAPIGPTLEQRHHH